MASRTFLFALAAALLLHGVAGADSSPGSEPDGRWLAETIGGVAAGAEITLSFGDDGDVSGNAGCNAYRGLYAANDADFAFSIQSLTRLACPRAIMDQEAEFISSLLAVRRWRIDPETGRLHLLDAAGATILRLRPQE